MRMTRSRGQTTRTGCIVIPGIYTFLEGNVALRMEDFHTVCGLEA